MLERRIRIASSPVGDYVQRLGALFLRAIKLRGTIAGATGACLERILKDTLKLSPVSTKAPKVRPWPLVHLGAPTLYPARPWPSCMSRASHSNSFSERTPSCPSPGEAPPLARPLPRLHAHCLPQILGLSWWALA